MKFFTTRLVYLYLFLFSATLIAVALYMEHAMGLEPCPLCMTQRIFFILTGLTALAAFIHNPQVSGKTFYGGFASLFAITGGGFALRQIWLQQLPVDEVPACGPSIGFMLREFPLTEFLATMFSGDGNCAEINWIDPLIGMSIAQWSLVGFIVISGLCLYQTFRA